MPKIMRNNIEYAGSNSWEGTQAQYDALPVKYPNITYYITDTNGANEQFQPVVYSEDEREIGVWKDGKPVYQKTVVIPSGTLLVGDNITDISGLGVDIVVGQPSACIVFDNGSSMRTIPFAISGNYGVELYADKSRIDIIREGVGLAYNNIFVTLRYTKTTDQPGSGQWTPQGVPAVHYSTAEQIIGTWIDGSTLYEKTYDFISSDFHGGTQSSAEISCGLWIDQLNYDYINIEGGCVWFDTTATNDVRNSPLNYYSSSNAYTRANIQLSASANDGYPYIWFEDKYATPSWYTNISHLHIFVTIRYTKATS